MVDSAESAGTGCENIGLFLNDTQCRMYYLFKCECIGRMYYLFKYECFGRLFLVRGWGENKSSWEWNGEKVLHRARLNVILKYCV